jgi:hypothetical protein
MAMDKEQERIVSCAIRDGLGYIGASIRGHGAAYTALTTSDQRHVPAALKTKAMFLVKGMLTSEGRFLEMLDAWKLGSETGGVRIKFDTWYNKMKKEYGKDADKKLEEILEDEDAINSCFFSTALNSTPDEVGKGLMAQSNQKIRNQIVSKYGKPTVMEYQERYSGD